MSASSPSLVSRWYPRIYEWYFTRTPIGRALRARENAVTFAALERLVQGGETLLDMGCGTGQYTLPLAAKARRIVAIDPSQPMLDHLERRAADQGIANVETRQGGAPEAVPTSGEFDGVVMIGVFNYIEPFAEVVAALGAAVRPGGWILFTVVPDSLEGKVHQITDRVVRSQVYLRPAAEVRAAAAAAGLEAEHLGVDGLTKGGIDSIWVLRRPS
jgi:cyclopropane fatty-acyl-phospholipid synthase-like methyltransferase